MTAVQNEGKEVRQFWLVMISVEGLEGTLLAYGTRTEMLIYMKNTISLAAPFRYRSASEEDVINARKLGIKAYIC